MRMLAYLPVSLQIQDKNHHVLAIPEFARRELYTVDGFQKVSVLRPAVSKIRIAQNAGIDSATRSPSFRGRGGCTPHTFRAETEYHGLATRPNDMADLHSWWMYPLLTLLGGALGTYGSLIGAGGGIFLVPVLLLLYPRES